jgi:glycosyltransferase involved in cell wall biosynthesis
MRPLTVGYFPYNPGANPYQRLFAEALESAGVVVQRIPPRKLFPLQHAAAQDVDLLQLDWPHDWYQGRNLWTRQVKRWMYRDGLRRLRRVPVVWTAHNLHAHDAANEVDEHRMIQALIDVCSGIIVLSNASAELLRTEYRVSPQTRVQGVHHGHYMDCYPNTVSREKARRFLGLPDEARVVLSLGRLQPYKGLEDLVDAFCSVAKDGDVLLLAGKSVSEDYTVRLRALGTARARPGIRVEVSGELVEGDELQIYFNACDLVALPFRKVLNSGSLLLAMSFGCPVVAPRMGSIPEVACPAGWFGYDPNDALGLHGALSQALAWPDLRAARRAVRAFTAARYDWGAVGKTSRALYDAIVDSPR